MMDPVHEPPRIAGPVAHPKRPHRRKHLAVPKRHPVRRVIGDIMPPLLGFEQQREGRIAADIDPLDRVHLHRDFEMSAIDHPITGWGGLTHCNALRR